MKLLFNEKSITYEVFKNLCYLSLWGNQADLSLSAGNVDKMLNKENKNTVLVDDTKELYNYLLSKGCNSTICLITDNVGSEILLDLFVVYKLLSTNFIGKVVISVKNASLFVSDVIKADIDTSLKILEEIGEEALIISKEIKYYILTNQIAIESQSFYNDDPRSFYYMPKELYYHFKSMDCLIFKGDANYRKLLDDKDFEYDTSFQNIVDYFPTSIVAFRTMKSNAASGINIEIQNKMKKVNEKWNVDGTSGLIQFVKH